MKKDNVIFRDSAGFNVSDGKTDHEGVEYEFNWLALDTLSLSLVACTGGGVPSAGAVTWAGLSETRSVLPSTLTR